jgi:glucose-1-phosphate thymidylyltransferase
MKGIVLAGGTGSRLWPITRSVSKQLLPVYDKPMIYYPISTLMLAGIREILIITTPHDQPLFEELLGDGSDLGITFHYAQQPEPNGLAQAFIIGEDFLAGDSCLMILGDNIFHGIGLGAQLRNNLPNSGAHIFTYEVANPNQYGILTVSKEKIPLRVEEKPVSTTSNLAITGLYFFDNRVSEIAKGIQPSKRGELEIVSIIEKYLEKSELTVTNLSRGVAWLDTGNPIDMHDAATYIRVMEERTGLKIGCIEEVAFTQKWIGTHQLSILADKNGGGSYSNYLRKLLN